MERTKGTSAARAVANAGAALPRYDTMPIERVSRITSTSAPNIEFPEGWSP
jgi:hypothetical protein